MVAFAGGRETSAKNGMKPSSRCRIPWCAARMRPRCRILALPQRKAGRSNINLTRDLESRPPSIVMPLVAHSVTAARPRLGPHNTVGSSLATGTLICMAAAAPTASRTQQP